jgi:hypothetical protein
MTSTSQKRLLTTSDLDGRQQDAIDFLYENDRGILVAAKGFGKTVVSLTAITERITDGVNRRVLITGPVKTAENWRKEQRDWAHLIHPVTILKGDEEKRAKLIRDTKNKILFVSINLLPWFLDNHADAIDGLVIDELTKFSDPGSVSVKQLRKHTSRYAFVAGMTASPVMESPLKIYAQALVIDGGQTLGTRYDGFKQQYFMKMDYKGYKWDLLPGAGERLMKALSGLVFVADDVSYSESLPDLKDEIVTVNMPERAWDLYKKSCDDMLIDFDDGASVEIVNAAVLSGKLEQIVQGRLYDSDGTSQYAHDHKFSRLKYLVSESKSPVVLMYQFQFEKDWIKHHMPDALILGETPDAVEKFNTGKHAVLALHAKSGGHGLNLQTHCHELICTKPIWSSDQWDQVIGRIWRRGQAHACRRRTLVVPGSIDELILNRLAGKEILAKELSEHLKMHAARG